MLTRLSPDDLALARAREALGETRDVQRRRLGVLRDRCYPGYYYPGNDDHRALAAGGLLVVMAGGRCKATGLGRAFLAEWTKS